MATGADKPRGTRTIKAPSSRQSASSSWMRSRRPARKSSSPRTASRWPSYRPHREKPKTLYGLGRDRMKIIGDIISPIDVEWEAMVNPDRVINPT